MTCCRLCDSSGVWTGAAPSCQLISCGDPPMLPHSAVALLNGTTQWRALALYSCLPGHDAAPGEMRTLQRVCYVGGFILHCHPSKAPTQWRWRLCHSPPPGPASLAAQLLGLALKMETRNCEIKFIQHPTWQFCYWPLNFICCQQTTHPEIVPNYYTIKLFHSYH